MWGMKSAKAEPVAPAANGAPSARAVRLSALGNDVKAEVEGKWFDYPEGGSFLIGRIGNSKYSEYVRRRSADMSAENHAHKIKGVRGDYGLTNEQLVALSNEAAAKYILLGWRDILGDDGQPLPYDEKTAMAILTGQATRDLAAWILGMADQGRQFRVQAEEHLSGN